MSDFTLGNGKEITFDLSQLSHKDWKGLVNPKQAKEKEEVILSRVFGLTVEELDKLSEVEYRKLNKAFVMRVLAPISADPNA